VYDDAEPLDEWCCAYDDAGPPSRKARSFERDDAE